MSPEKLKTIQQRIKQLDTIPTVPAVIQPLMQLLQKPAEDIRLDQLKNLVSYDKAIAAQCLRMANSPLFGRRSVETVGDAVVALGTKRIQSIVISCSLNRLVDPKKSAFDPEIFWRHSLGCALVTRKMAQAIGYPDPGEGVPGRPIARHRDSGELNRLRRRISGVYAMGSRAFAWHFTRRKNSAWDSIIARAAKSSPITGISPKYDIGNRVSPLCPIRHERTRVGLSSTPKRPIVPRA